LADARIVDPTRPAYRGLALFRDTLVAFSHELSGKVCGIERGKDIFPVSSALGDSRIIRFVDAAGLVMGTI
jgi:hypothetical protein